MKSEIEKDFKTIDEGVEILKVIKGWIYRATRQTGPGSKDTSREAPSFSDE
jgi:hypothetical protein